MKTNRFPFFQNSQNNVQTGLSVGTDKLFSYKVEHATVYNPQALAQRILGGGAEQRVKALMDCCDQNPQLVLNVIIYLYEKSLFEREVEQTKMVQSQPQEVQQLMTKIEKIKKELNNNLSIAEKKSPREFATYVEQLFVQDVNACLKELSLYLKTLQEKTIIPKGTALEFEGSEELLEVIYRLNRFIKTIRPSKPEEFTEESWLNKAIEEYNALSNAIGYLLRPLK